MSTFICFLLGVFSLPHLVSCESPAPLSQGTCPDGWVDGSLVDMGCLYFNLTEPMTWFESMQSCQLGYENAAAVEIISAEVFIEFEPSNLYIHKTLQQMDFIKAILTIQGEVIRKKIILF